MKELIATCPYRVCNQVIFRKGRAEIKTEKSNIFIFTTKCPHCKNLVEIKLGIEIKTKPVV